MSVTKEDGLRDDTLAFLNGELDPQRVDAYLKEVEEIPHASDTLVGLATLQRSLQEAAPVRPRIRWLPPLALAATLLLGVGIWGALSSEPGGPTRKGAPPPVDIGAEMRLLRERPSGALDRHLLEGATVDPGDLLHIVLRCARPCAVRLKESRGGGAPQPLPWPHLGVDPLELPGDRVERSVAAHRVQPGDGPLTLQAEVWPAGEAGEGQPWTTLPITLRISPRPDPANAQDPETP